MAENAKSANCSTPGSFTAKINGIKLAINAGVKCAARLMLQHMRQGRQKPKRLSLGLVIKYSAFV
jgi:hypothetical protein